MKSIYIIPALAVLLVSCTAKANEDKAVATTAEPQTVAPSLTLPVVPDSLTSVADRAAYASLHFWDSLDFSSGAAACDTAFMEQNFANFAALLSMASDDDVERAVKNVVTNAANGSRKSFDMICYIAAKYLDEPNSPMRNEELYIPFLRNIVRSTVLSDDERIRPAYRLEQALKNRPGHMATDFDFDLRQGGSSTLHTVCTKADMTLLIFYDPDCSHCKEIMAEISNAPLRPGVNVLAIDFVGDRDLWSKTAPDMPASWTVGFATSPIEDDDLYSLPATPTLYLIDSENRVILKDPHYSIALDYITRRS